MRRLQDERGTLQAVKPCTKKRGRRYVSVGMDFQFSLDGETKIESEGILSRRQRKGLALAEI